VFLPFPPAFFRTPVVFHPEKSSRKRLECGKRLEEKGGKQEGFRPFEGKKWYSLPEKGISAS
jgi:hypothetical protein